ncbi:MAG: hypothetical protein JXR64_05885 [Spirochaetales bacterium]|nr:hypothetical protein [Spirochaetales bacterium]
MKKLIILMLLAACFNLYAVNLTGSSPTQKVTGTGDEPLDIYLSTTRFSELDSSVLFLQFDMPAAYTTSPFQAGIGHFLTDNIYIGARLSLSNLGPDETKTETLNSDSAVLTDSSGAYTGYNDTTDSQFYNIDNSSISGVLMGGIKLSALNIGFNASVSSTNSTENGKTSATLGAVSADSISSLSFTGPSMNTSKTKTIFDNQGNKTYEEITDYSNDGYKKNETTGYIANAGAKMSIASFVFNGEFNFSMTNYDYSDKSLYTQTKTNFTSVLPVYEGITGLYSYNKTDADKKNIYSQLMLGGKVTTVYPINEKLSIESGLGFRNTDKTYTDGGITDTYNDTLYTVAIDTTNSEFYTTTTTTKAFSSKDEKTYNKKEFTIPVNLKSKLSDRIEVNFYNDSTFLIENTTSNKSGTYTEQVATVTSDDLADDTTTLKTVTFRDASTEGQTIEFTNMSYVGAKFFFTDKLRFNLGSTIYMQPYKLTSSNQYNNGLGTETNTTTVNGVTSDSSTTSIVVDPNSGTNPQSSSVQDASDTYVMYNAGFTYFFSEDMKLDLYMDGNGGNLFDTAEWGLLLTLKY